MADTGNSRILFFKNISTANNQLADDLYGNIGFDAIGEHLDVGKENRERIYWPFGVTVSSDQLMVADTGNHWVIFYTLIPLKYICIPKGAYHLWRLHSCF